MSSAVVCDDLSVSLLFHTILLPADFLVLPYNTPTHIDPLTC